MRQLATGTPRLLVHVHDGVGTVVLNNPEQRNAITGEMQRAIPPTLAELERDPTVHVVVVRGAGDRAFASGADVVEFHESRGSEAARTEYDAALAAFWAAWAAFTKPTIAMVRGFCLGGGLLLAVQADIRIAGVQSEFAMVAARTGTGVAAWGVEALLALAGPAVTAEMLYSGRRLSAHEALAVRLVNRVVPDAELERATFELAAAIAANVP